MSDKVVYELRGRDGLKVGRRADEPQLVYLIREWFHNHNGNTENLHVAKITLTEEGKESERHLSLDTFLFNQIPETMYHTGLCLGEIQKIDMRLRAIEDKLFPKEEVDPNAATK